MDPALRIEPWEKEIVGGFKRRGLRQVPDENAERIAVLRRSLLEKVSASSEHYTVLYKDPSDDRFWELVFAEPSSHAGGEQVLRNISFQLASDRYGIICTDTLKGG